MAVKIPTILGDGSIRTALPTINVDGDDLSSAQSIGNVARGIMNVSAGLGDLSNDLGAIEQKQRDIEDSRWIRDNQYEEKNALNEWLADPKNTSREDYATEFKRVAEERLNTRVQGAPSSRAADALMDHIQGFIERTYPHTLQTQTETKLINTRAEIDENVGLMVDSFRKGRNAPNNDAERELNFDTNELMAYIDELYGGIAPAHASKLKEHVVTQVVLGTMDTDPRYARKFLEKHKVDEKVRNTLNNQIDSAERAALRVDQDQFESTRRDFITAAANGKVRGKIGMEEYVAHYGKEQAIIEKRKDDAILNIYDSANKKTESIGAFNGAAQIAEANKLGADVRTFHDQKVAELVAHRIKESVKLQDDNSVLWLKQNNPTVKSAIVRYTDAPDDATRQRELIGIFDSISKYQQNPPIDSKEDPRLFLGKPSNGINVLEVDTAEKDALFINTGSPKEAIKRIRETLAKYPKKYHYTVFHDLVRLPKDGIRQEYQFAFQNADAWWVDSYLAAVEVMGPMEKLSDVKKADLYETIDKDPTWKAFETSMIGEDAIRGEQMEGFKNGVAAYARSIEKTTGKKLGASVKQATELLINSTMGFADINGQTLAVHRVRPDGSKRTDEEITDIGRRLAVTLSEVPIQHVNVDNFPFMGAFQDKGSVAAMQTLRDAITTRGFWSVGDDGEHVTLYYTDDNGSFFQVTDKEKQPFIVYYDDLPAYTERKLTVGGGSPFPGSNVSLRDVPIKPQGTYPLEKIPDNVGTIDRILGTYQKRTYWPTNAPHIRNTKK